MENNIFRKKSIERVSSPEQLNDYIRVSNPGIWTVMIAIIILLFGVCVWGVFGHLDTTLDTVAIKKDGTLTVYIKEADIVNIEEGQSLTVGNKEYRIAEISKTPTDVSSEDFNDYALHVGELSLGEWVYEITAHTASSEALTDGVYKANIVIDSVSPMSFVFN